MKFLVPNYSCPQNPWLGGYRPSDPRSLCPLSSNEFVEPPPPPEKKSWVLHCCTGLDIWKTDVGSPYWKFYDKHSSRHIMLCTKQIEFRDFSGNASSCKIHFALHSATKRESKPNVTRHKRACGFKTHGRASRGDPMSGINFIPHWLATSCHVLLSEWLVAIVVQFGEQRAI
jgi:hypothetical protein